MVRAGTKRGGASVQRLKLAGGGVPAVRGAFHQGNAAVFVCGIEQTARPAGECGSAVLDARAVGERAGHREGVGADR